MCYIDLINNFGLINDQSPNNNEEVEYICQILYSNAIGSIIHLMVFTWLDLDVTAAGLCLTWVLIVRRLSSDVGLMLMFSADSMKLKGFLNANYTGYMNNRKFTSFYAFSLCNSCISLESSTLIHICTIYYNIWIHC